MESRSFLFSFEKGRDFLPFAEHRQQNFIRYKKTEKMVICRFLEKVILASIKKVNQ
jgi:hypothetical protein